MVQRWPQLLLAEHFSSSTVSYTVVKAKWLLVEQTIVAGVFLLLVFLPEPKKRHLALGKRSSRIIVDIVSIAIISSTNRIDHPRVWASTSL